jgi:hypothetical protein
MAEKEALEYLEKHIEKQVESFESSKRYYRRGSYPDYIGCDSRRNHDIYYWIQPDLSCQLASGVVTRICSANYCSRSVGSLVWIP